MKSNFYNYTELLELGFNKIGNNTLISKKASFYGCENIIIGDNVRIDDFCILSGKIVLGSYIHISAYTGIWGGNSGVIIEDYSGISSHCSIYSISDDYSGAYLCNAMCPRSSRNVTSAQVIIHRYVQIAAGCTVLPGVDIGEGSVVGSMSLVNKNIPDWQICIGVPCKVLKKRSNTLLNYLK